MVPIAVQKIIIGSAPGPSILVLQPIEESPVPGISRIVPIMGGRRRSGFSSALGCHAYQGCTPHDARPACSTPSPTLMQAFNHVLYRQGEGIAVFREAHARARHGRLIELDARPSDALSLALREDAPLYINEDVLERASYPYIVRNPIEDESAEAELEEFRSFRGGPRPQRTSLVSTAGDHHTRRADHSPRDHPAQPATLLLRMFQP